MKKCIFLVCLIPPLVSCINVNSPNNMAHYNWPYKRFEKRNCNEIKLRASDREIVIELEKIKVQADDFIDRRQLYYNRTLVCKIDDERLLVFAVGANPDLEAIIKLDSRDKIVDYFIYQSF